MKSAFLKLGSVGSSSATGGQSMFWDGFQWVPRADTGITNDINASRKNRPGLEGGLADQTSRRGVCLKIGDNVGI